MNYIDWNVIDDERPKRPRAKPHFVRVLVFDIAQDQQIREHGINYSKLMIDKDQKLKWLLDMILWATKNGKSVEIMSEEDWKAEQEN